ncbi:MAG: sulfatase [Gammaproteobacteria bacterium]|nr:sulfatase [Gammaproteobacteria bacterium]
MIGFTTVALRDAALGTLSGACLLTLLLALKSLRDYTTTGPLLPADVMRQFRGYAMLAFLRLALVAFGIALYWGCCGLILALGLAALAGTTVGFGGGFAASVATICGAVAFQMSHVLLLNPAVIVASSHYRISRFLPLWRRLSPQLLHRATLLLAMAVTILVGGAAWRLTTAGQGWAAMLLIGSATLLYALAWFATRAPDIAPTAGVAGSRDRPNILLIGSDTLRADRLGIAGYPRALTPTIDALAERGTWFENCYVPCGRTAPSLVSLLTGTWPQTHGIRDNFIADDDTKLKIPALPRLFAAAGYRTAAISDWCGADLGKFDFGFAECDLPQDSWNLHYMLRQGPKDLRLFLSLFLRNRLGKRLLPEIYYLGGVPSTDLLGPDVRAHISAAARDARPFLINAFFSTTHPPFGSEYPYYLQYADPAYAGPSKFAMARLTDPFEIIRRQGEPKKEFDLDQILALYDGCVRRFDDEVGRILDHLDACGLADRTIVVVYSDHGMDFFEHGTWGQGNSVVGDYSARIPLLVLDPRRAGGHRIGGIVRSIDLAPTLLEIAGLNVPAVMEGVSLQDCLNGVPPPDLPVYNESGIWFTELPGMPDEHLRYPGLFEILEVPDPASGTIAVKPVYRNRVTQAKDRMLRLGHWKLTYQPLEVGARYALFDLRTDPGCRNDLSEQQPDIVSQLAMQMQTWIGERS